MRLLALIATFCLTRSTMAIADADTGLPAEDSRSVFERAHPGGDYETELRYQQSFRDQFDFLVTTEEAFAKAFSEGVRNRSSERWGVDLSDIELAEMERRDRVQKEFPGLAAAVVGEDWSEELVEGLDPDGTFGAFAGRWIDQMDGGRLVIAVAESHPGSVQSLERLADALDAAIGRGSLVEDDVKVIFVRYSADDLYGVNGDFAVKYLEDNGRRQIGMSASMSPTTNEVLIYAEHAWLAEAESFASTYPEGLVNVRLVPDGSLLVPGDTDPDDDWGHGDWHSGASLAIRDGSSELGICQWGATARTASYVYLVTAAHCLGSANEDNDYDQDSWWNNSVADSEKRYAKTNTGDDWISGPGSNVFVFKYHGVRGDLARLVINYPAAVDEHDCFLEDGVKCGKEISRREFTTETEIGDVKCVPLKTRSDYICATLNSNDAPILGYDFLRSVNTTSSTHSDGGDSGSGFKESTLLTGILRGHRPWPTYDTYFTHAYYIETSGYLAATAVCGTSGLC